MGQGGRHGPGWRPGSHQRLYMTPLIYPFSEKILKLAANISGDKLVSLGTCFGKFTKTHKFRLHVTALDYLAPYAKVCEVVCRRPLGMEEVRAEGHLRTQISGQLLCHGVPCRAWDQCQHVEMPVGLNSLRMVRAEGRECSDYLQQRRKAWANPAEDRKASKWL